MKKFLVFILILAVAAGVGYYWWQQNSHRIITQQVRRLASRFFVNPQSLSVENSAVKMRGLRDAHVGRLVISGKELQLRDGPVLASARLVLTDLDVTGPPFHLTHVGGGNYEAQVSDAAVTEYLHARGGSMAGVKIVPLSTVTVKFLPGEEATARLSGEAVIPLIDKRVPVIADGTLVPAADAGRVDFNVSRVNVTGLSFPASALKKSFGIVNPLVDLSGWPVAVKVGSINTVTGMATVKGHITGAADSLLKSF